ncbi:response regulator transcription factor [Caldimonas tepidiphila]|uniref:response regulator transcription factor n=1 Tax=Caldimonas tepidiphila TaxID=2315841 RepID=UPI00196AD129|nr:response regulator [Caldimonas tepidiphila]
MRPVLVVEDDRDIRESLVMILEHEGYVVAAAADGQEALDWLGRGQEPELILLDLMMPRVDGWEFLSCWQVRPAASRCPVIVLSGADVRQNPQGAEAVLRKPVSIDELLAAVGRHRP